MGLVGKQTVTRIAEVARGKILSRERSTRKPVPKGLRSEGRHDARKEPHSREKEDRDHEKNNIAREQRVTENLPESKSRTSESGKKQ